ncbi:MAG TPA: response regulator [Bryobacteraceae bacterium]|nr:response regulator [Bryobacteraceae bacterium]
MARVLVVDDDAVQIQLRKTMLEAAGHEVRGADNTAQAARLLAESRPEILLMDLRLPEMRDGLALIRAAHEVPSPPRVVVLSGWPADLEDHPEHALVAKVLAKPIRMQVLLEAIRELL